MLEDWAIANHKHNDHSLHLNSKNHCKILVSLSIMVKGHFIFALGLSMVSTMILRGDYVFTSQDYLDFVLGTEGTFSDP
jgi:hypothetical protein